MYDKLLLQLDISHAKKEEKLSKGPFIEHHFAVNTWPEQQRWRLEESFLAERGNNVFCIFRPVFSFCTLGVLWDFVLTKSNLPGPAYFALFKTVFCQCRPVVAVVFSRTLAEASCRVLFASEGPPSHVNGYLVLSHHVKRLLRWHYDQLLCKHPSFSNFYCPHFSLVTSKSELNPKSFFWSKWYLWGWTKCGRNGSYELT